MTETIDVATTAPTYPGDAPRPKRNGAKPLMPGSWISRGVRIEYLAGNECRETSGQLLDLYPAGMVVNIRGARTLLSWDRLVLCELVGD